MQLVTTLGLFLGALSAARFSTIVIGYFLRKVRKSGRKSNTSFFIVYPCLYCLFGLIEFILLNNNIFMLICDRFGVLCGCCMAKCDFYRVMSCLLNNKSIFRLIFLINFNIFLDRFRKLYFFIADFVIFLVVISGIIACYVTFAG